MHAPILQLRLRQIAWAALALGLPTAILSSTHAQGLLDPLTPPAPVMKTLDEVRSCVPIDAQHTPGDEQALYVLSEPGVYILTAPLRGEAGKQGVAIAAHGVTLDLNGFAVLGVLGSMDGIAFRGTYTNGVVRHGTVSGWGLRGVNALVARQARLEDLHASHNGTDGIALGSGSFATDCISIGNDTGFSAHIDCELRRCIALGNGRLGFTTSRGTRTWECASAQNGTIGVEVLNGGLVQDCAVSSNGGDGLVPADARLLDCFSMRNVGDAFELHSGNHLTGCVAWLNGEEAEVGCGIHVLGKGNSMNDNVLIGNDRGVHVEGTNNLIFGNRVARSASVNYLVVSTNRVAAIFTCPSSTAVTGSGGGAGLGSPQRWSNFSF